MTRRCIARVLFVACALLFVPPPATAAIAPTATGSSEATRDYAAALRVTAAALDRAAAGKKTPVTAVPDLHIPQAPESILAETPALRSSLDVWFRAGLHVARSEKSSAARATDLRALAASLRNTAKLATQPPGAAPHDLGATVTRVLAEPAFHKPVNRPQAAKKSWLETMLQMILEWWAKLFMRGIEAAAGVPAIGNLVAGILIAAAAVALVILAFRIATFVAKRRIRAAGLLDTGTELEVHAGVDETYDAARAAAHRGSYGVAIALLFQAALLALDRSGRVPYDAARTAGEYRRAVRRSMGAATASFETIARAFTIVAYAQVPAAESDWRAADAAYASLPFTAAERR